MQKLHENWIENPTWAENYKLEDIKFSIIKDLLKAMWHKYRRKKDTKHEKYNYFLSLAKTYKHYLA